MLALTGFDYEAVELICEKTQENERKTYVWGH